jgi:hypothetical protein
MVLGSGMALLDSTSLNVALPALGAELGADVAGLQWVLNGYLLSLSALILLGGALGDRYGRRRVFYVAPLRRAGPAAARAAGCRLSGSTLITEPGDGVIMEPVDRSECAEDPVSRTYCTRDARSRAWWAASQDLGGGGRRQIDPPLPPVGEMLLLVSTRRPPRC